MYEKVLSQNLYLPKRYIYINYIYREHKCMNMYWMRTSCLKSYTCESVLSENPPRPKTNDEKKTCKIRRALRREGSQNFEFTYCTKWAIEFLNFKKDNKRI